MSGTGPLCSARDSKQGAPFSGGGACAVVAAMWDQGLPPTVTGARSQLPGVSRDQSDTRRSAKTLTRPSPSPAPEPGTAFAVSLSAEPGEDARRGRKGCKAPQRGRVAATHPDSGRGPAPGQTVSGRSWPSPHDARQSRGGAGRSAPRSSPRFSRNP